MEQPPLRRRAASFESATTTIPDRSSSQNFLQSKPNKVVFSDALSLPPTAGKTIPSRGRSLSPIRRPESRALRKAPSRTFVPSGVLTEILDFPKLSHPRIALDIRLSSSLFVGGATVEGEVCVVVDAAKFSSASQSRPPIFIDRIMVTLVGVERSNGRQWIFRSLATELIDEAHPPPTTMTVVDQQKMEAMWEAVPSRSILPFRLNLPVIVGPPPHETKRVGIYYLLSVTVGANIAEKRVLVRKSQKIAVLTIHDPEKALINLPSPLLASDELQISDGNIKLTAGLHRQTWISGYIIFVDIHIVNSSRKAVRSIELQLEKVTAFHKHAAASTDQTPADLLRLPDHCEKDIARKWVMKESRDGWQGVKAHSEDIRTCQLELPTGLASIDTGRFFGIRYFLNIRLTASLPPKYLKVQLPITLIHPSSIDIPPNSLAQVAAAIEHKHRGRPSDSGLPYRYRPGQAFLAARQQSYEVLSASMMPRQEIESLASYLDDSPRKHMPRMRSHGGLPPSSYLAAMRSVSFESKARPSSDSQGPRLQRGTSAMGFDDDSEKENRLVRGRGGLQRGSELARKRSGVSGGWRNVAV